MTRSPMPVLLRDLALIAAGFFSVAALLRLLVTLVTG
jgi:hypothetical protein